MSLKYDLTNVTRSENFKWSRPFSMKKDRKKYGSVIFGTCVYFAWRDSLDIFLSFALPIYSSGFRAARPYFLRIMYIYFILFYFYVAVLFFRHWLQSSFVISSSFLLLKPQNVSSITVKGVKLEGIFG